jgi:predicted RNA methylase
LQITQEVTAVLERAESTDAGIRLVDQLDRALYVKVNKVLEATGWRWDRKAKAHIHPSAAPADALDSLLAAGEVVTAAELGFFETQGEALARLMAWAEVRPGMLVLEPSAGEGAIVRECVAHGADVTAIELDEGRWRAMLAWAPDSRCLCIQGDFLLFPNPNVARAPHGFDRVVMNPPFARQQDLAHVLHALDFLKVGGRLSAIMSAGVSFRQDRRTQDFHQRIAPYSPEWIPLPAGAFKASGTMVNTTILTLVKR